MDSIRKEQEAREHQYLSPYAAFSDMSAGRDEYEYPCDIRTEYQRDRDRIIHCKSFRRLISGILLSDMPEREH